MATATPPDSVLAETVRREAGSIVASLHRLTGNFDVAEEAVQEAVIAALRAWRRDGIPPNPGGWLMLTARRKAIDRLRRDARRAGATSRLAGEQAVGGQAASVLSTGRQGAEGTGVQEAVDAALAQEAGLSGGSSAEAADERVGMLFGCCHPALAVEARLALTLRAVVGLTTVEIARSFLVPEATLAQRIVRAKQKIVANGIRMAVPTDGLAQRLDDVLTVVYLTYNAGFLLPGASLAGDALWLAELVTTRLPGEPEAWGLLALLTLQLSRARARFDHDGRLVLLPDQDRSRWDHAAIARAERYLERSAAFRRPGRFQLQAAIAACHASAPSWPETDWLQILTLYDLLVRHDPSPVVRLNRAVALGEYAGPGPALAEVDALAARLSSYHLLHATRGSLLRRLGRPGEARAADEAALALAGTTVERDLLLERLARQVVDPVD